MSRARLKAVLDSVTQRNLKTALGNIGGPDRKVDHEKGRKVDSEPNAPLIEIMDDFYRRMADDILVGYFFTGKDLHQIATRQVEFLRHVTGDLSNYTGKLPVSAHLGLPPIFSGHFDRRQVILRQTLKDHGLTPEEIQTWLDFENAFRGVIVQN